jgi:NTP pyrophosphatase (non-canonical NTP hydrolase)
MGHPRQGIGSMKTSKTKSKTETESKTEIRSITDAIRKFRDARDWGKFHDPKNLAICLNVEAAELLEVFLWKNGDEIDLESLKEELADVFYSAFLLADKFGLDVGAIVRAKLKKNAKKYPVRKAKGSRKKYTEL